VQATTVNLQTFLSKSLAGTAEVRFYNRADSPPRTPYHTDTTSVAFTPPDETPLPREVALCLSMHADLSSGVERARRRGRIYIGPCNINILPASHTDFHVSATAVNTLAQAAAALTTELDGHGIALEVWSETDGVGRAVQGGWVDNAYDIQRRRGNGPSARTLWSAP
jgi:hypothetical protein